MHKSTILPQFHKLFSSYWLNNFAKRIGFVKRASSKIRGADICELLLQAVNFPCELSLNGFCNLLFQMKGIKMRSQSLWERIVNPLTASYMKGIYFEILSCYTKRIQDICSKIDCNFFKLFSRILLEDSTVISLNEKLTCYFRGTGGLASKSSLKMHLVFDVITNLIKSLKIHQGRHPDAGLSQEVLSFITEKTLLIRDLGFFLSRSSGKFKIRGPILSQD